MKTEPTKALRAMANSLKYNVGVIHSNQQLILEESFISGVRYGQSSPKIKQLEWNFYGTYYSAETPVIDYIITHENGFIVNEGECALWVNGFPISHSTLEEAKAAAQADFERRVMECLDIADNSNK